MGPNLLTIHLTPHEWGRLEAAGLTARAGAAAAAWLASRVEHAAAMDEGAGRLKELLEALDAPEGADVVEYARKARALIEAIREAYGLDFDVPEGVLAAWEALDEVRKPRPLPTGLGWFWGRWPHRAGEGGEHYPGHVPVWVRWAGDRWMAYGMQTRPDLPVEDLLWLPADPAGPTKAARCVPPDPGTEAPAKAPPVEPYYDPECPDCHGGGVVGRTLGDPGDECDCCLVDPPEPPRPCPEPQKGQVWTWEGHIAEVTRVRGDAVRLERSDGAYLGMWSRRVWASLVRDERLISGPGAPWTGARYEGGE